MKTPHSNSQNPPGHMPGLDALRGLAILAVMFHHFLPPNYPQGIPGGMAGLFAKACYRLCDVGWWGVDLFFVLSGFLITGILLAAKGTPHFFRNFYVRRNLRIFPLYYGLLVALFILLPALARQPAWSQWMNRYLGDFLSLSTQLKPLQGWIWLYGVNLKTALVADGWIFGKLTHLWSLAIEEHFYLFWPLVVFFAKPRYLIRICLGIAAFSFILRAVLFFSGWEASYIIYILTPCRLDSLVLGGLMAILYQSQARPALLEKCRRAFPWLLTASVLVTLMFNRFGDIFIIAGHTLLGVTFAVAMPLTASLVRQPKQPLHTRWMFNPVLRTFGKYSYGIYLLHPFMIEPVSNFMKSPSISFFINGNYVLLAIFRAIFGISAAIFVAFLSWHLFEKHFLKLKQFFPSKYPKNTPNPPTEPAINPLRNSAS